LVDLLVGIGHRLVLYTACSSWDGSRAGSKLARVSHGTAMSLVGQCCKTREYVPDCTNIDEASSRDDRDEKMTTRDDADDARPHRDRSSNGTEQFLSPVSSVRSARAARKEDARGPAS